VVNCYASQLHELHMYGGPLDIELPSLFSLCSRNDYHRGTNYILISSKPFYNNCCTSCNARCPKLETQCIGTERYFCHSMYYYSAIVSLELVTCYPVECICICTIFSRLLRIRVALFWINTQLTCRHFCSIRTTNSSWNRQRYHNLRYIYILKYQDYSTLAHCDNVATTRGLWRECHYVISKTKCGSRVLFYYLLSHVSAHKGSFAFRGSSRTTSLPLEA
jgi:hypothetical protein